MANLKEAQELANALRSLSRLSDPHERRVSALEVAEQFYKNHLELIEPFITEWVIGKLAVLVERDRAQEEIEENPLSFDCFLGLKLPAVIHLDGRIIPRDEAQIGTFRRLARQLRALKSPELEDAKNAIALMAKYTPKQTQITWREVVRREAAARERAKM